jgi:predicted metal-binding protein
MSSEVDLEDLLLKLEKVHPDIRSISAEDVVVANWVRLKCRDS